jgi:hypothetical protein
MKKVLLAATAATFYVCALTAAIAIDFPVQDQHITQHNRHQRSTTDVTIQGDGTITASSRFENAKQLDGDHYTAVVVVLGTDRQPLAVIKQTKGVNARGWGRTQVVLDTTTGKIPPNLLNQIGAIEIQHGFWDSRNDQEWWRKAIQVGGQIAQIMQGEGSGFAVRN